METLYNSTKQGIKTNIFYFNIVDVKYNNFFRHWCSVCQYSKAGSKSCESHCVEISKEQVYFLLW